MMNNRTVCSEKRTVLRHRARVLAACIMIIIIVIKCFVSKCIIQVVMYSIALHWMTLLETKHFVIWNEVCRSNRGFSIPIPAVHSYLYNVILVSLTTFEKVWRHWPLPIQAGWSGGLQWWQGGVIFLIWVKKFPTPQGNKQPLPKVELSTPSACGRGNMGVFQLWQEIITAAHFSMLTGFKSVVVVVTEIRIQCSILKLSSSKHAKYFLPENLSSNFCSFLKRNKYLSLFLNLNTVFFSLL